VKEKIIFFFKSGRIMIISFVKKRVEGDWSNKKMASSLPLVFLLLLLSFSLPILNFFGKFLEN